jgi:hypothetical protein
VKPETRAAAEDWLAELERLGAAPGEGHTCRELQRAWGVSDRVATNRLHQLAAAGRIRVARKTITALSGNATTVPSYVLLPAPKGKARGR